MVTVIIPALNEKYLQKTIENVLENAEGEIEIIAVCDGYWPTPSIKDHPYVNIIHHSEPRGQRHSINEAARVAKGEYIMKLDAHCAVGPKFNTILERDCEYDMTMIPRMYNLDIETWQPKLKKRTDYMFIGMVEGNLRAQYYSGSGQRQPNNDKMIDETMCCMGPSFFMHKKRFWELGGCDEEHGHWGQQGVEVSCKAWLSGGRLVVNKNTWFAHWFRGHYVHDSGRKGFPYSIKQRDINAARAYSNDLWMNNKWPQQTRTFQWLLNKFNPPTWESQNAIEDKLKIFDVFYKKLRKEQKDKTFWRGKAIQKFPTDIMLYQEILSEKKPDLVIEIGTKWGGSALFMQDILDLNGGGKVITIDHKDQVTEKDQRITYLIGKSGNKEIIEQVKSFIQPTDKVMVVVDGDHSRTGVKWDLYNYSPFVTAGQYMVVEDCYLFGNTYHPYEAKEWFLKNYKNRGFKQTDVDDKYIMGLSMGGWLIREE